MLCDTHPQTVSPRVRSAGLCVLSSDDNINHIWLGSWNIHVDPSPISCATKNSALFFSVHDSIDIYCEYTQNSSGYGCKHPSAHSVIIHSPFTHHLPKLYAKNSWRSFIFISCNMFFSLLFLHLMMFLPPLAGLSSPVPSKVRATQSSNQYSLK